MGEIAYTKFGRNALFIGLISHVAALLAAMMPSPGSAFFKIVYSFAWLALILGAYVELENRGYWPFGNWRFYIIAAVNAFPFIGPLIAFLVLYRLQRGGEEERVRVCGMFASVLRLRANLLVLFIFIVILFILFAVILSRHDPYFKKANLKKVLLNKQQVDIVTCRNIYAVDSSIKYLITGKKQKITRQF